MSEQITETNFDVIVVGAGPAGLTAGMYAARQGLKTAIVAGEIGGQAAWASEVENYLGWRLVSGAELVQNFRDHVSQFGVACFEGQLINAVIPNDEGFGVFTREGASLQSKAIIIATGRAHSKLSVPGEQEFIGRGVSYCATCDASFFRGKPVVVVGSTEAAADAALELAALDAQVTLLITGAMHITEILMKRLEESPLVEIRTRVAVKEILGDTSVNAVRILNRMTKEEENIEAKGVFIEMGSIAAAEFTGGLVEVNEKGEITIANDGATNIEGIYAAGDVTDTPGKQIIIAAGEGATAAMAVSRYLKRR